VQGEQSRGHKALFGKTKVTWRMSLEDQGLAKFEEAIKGEAEE
jgi:hypothetical protein